MATAAAVPIAVSQIQAQAQGNPPERIVLSSIKNNSNVTDNEQTLVFIIVSLFIL